MKKIDLGQTIAILANVGILVSIVFLAVEVRQNQASLEEGNRINLISSRASAFTATSNFRLLMAENSELVEIWMNGRAGTLSDPIDEARFGYLCNEFIWRVATNYERNSFLGNEESATANALEVSRSVSMYPGIRQCWKEIVEQIRRYGLQSFVDMVQEVSR